MNRTTDHWRDVRVLISEDHPESSTNLRDERFLPIPPYIEEGLLWGYPVVTDVQGPVHGTPMLGIYFYRTVPDDRQAARSSALGSA